MTDDLAIEALLDLLDGIESGIAQARMRIKTAKLPPDWQDSIQHNKPQAEERKYDWNPTQIRWDTVSGPSGTYQRTPTVMGLPTEQEIAEYQKMLKDLEAHGNKLTREGFFYWRFIDQITVGRKQKTVKP